MVSSPVLAYLPNHPRDAAGGILLSAAIPELVPWSWGVNGCASVLSAILAMILAIHFGFTVVVALAVCLYLGAAATFRRPLSGAQPGPS
jgi:hypothetical protein